jgi:hypothetical protein
MPKSGLRIFGLRSGCRHYDGHSDENYAPNDDPGLRDAEQNRANGEADDKNDESDQVGAEG